MAAESERRSARREGKMEREVSRGGESEAKALAEAGRGAVRAERGGAAADYARSATLANGVSAETHRSQNALAAGWRFSRPRWPEGQPDAPRAVGAAFAAVAARASAARALGCACGSARRDAARPDTAARSHIGARRRASCERRRGAARASEG